MLGISFCAVPSPDRREAEDFLVVTARRMLVVGLVLTSLLSVRIGPVTVGDIFLVGAAATLAVAYAKPRVPPTPPLLWVAAWCIVVGACLSGWRSQDLTDHVLVAARLIFLIVVLPWMIRSLLNTPARLTRGGMAWIVGAAISGAGTIAQATLGPGAIPGGGVTSDGRYTGFTGHVSDAGGVTACAVAFSLIGLAVASTRKARIGHGLVLIGAGAGLVLSGSVSGMLSAVGAVVVLAVSRRIPATRLVISAVIALAGLYVGGTLQADTAGALNPVERLVQTTGRGSFVRGASGGSLNTAGTRVETNAAALDATLASPLAGAGLDGESAFVETNMHTFQPHNVLIGAAYRGGLFVLIGISIPLVWVIARGWSTVRDRRFSPMYGAMLAAVAFAMTAPSLYNRYLWVPVAFIASPMMFQRAGRLLHQPRRRPALADIQ